MANDDKVQLYIIRQSCLNRAIEYEFHKGGQIVDIKGILDTANEFVDWVYGKTSKTVSNNINLPVPMLHHKAILDKIVEQTGRSFDDVCKATLDWTEQHPQVKRRIYPNKESSIPAFIKWWKENKNE